MTKEHDHEHPKWPEELENAFLDALLLIPQMARKKFAGEGQLYGRNMLITEYLWIYHWLLHPPAEGEKQPTTKEAEKCNNGQPHAAKKDTNEDDRKYTKEETDIESFKHNRVLQAISNGHLPEQRPNYEYFGRLLHAGDDVFIRPKQCRIYVSSQKVEIKKREVPAEDGTKGKKQVQILGYHRDTKERIFDQTDYPHLDRNYIPAYETPWSDATTTLLHSYTNELHLKEACAIQEISNRWSMRFPDLVDKLKSSMEDGKEPDAQSELSSRCVLGPIDALHLEVVLDLHDNARFPDGSHCNGLVELELARPGLFRDHSWRTITTVAKPRALYYEDKGREVDGHKSEASLIPGHVANCVLSSGYKGDNAEGHKHAAAAARGHIGPGYPRCDCSARGALDSIVVRFPAESWANTFVMLAPYVKAAHEEVDREIEIDRWISDDKVTSGGPAQGGSGLQSGAAAAAAAGKQGKGPRKRAASSPSPSPPPPQKKARPSSSSSAASSASAAAQADTATPKGAKKRELVELLQEVAMYQEIYSAPPVEQPMGAGAAAGVDVKPPQQKWTRRAVLVWTFAPALKTLGTRAKGKKGEGKPRPIREVQPRTNWRYLTKLDPSSQYHQKHAYLNGSPAVIRPSTASSISRNAVMSPDPAYMQHAHAAMNENFGAATADMYNRHHHHQHHQQPLMAHPQNHQHQFHHPHVSSMAGPSAPSLSLDVSGGYVDVVGGSGGYDGVGGGLATPPPTASTLQGNGYNNSNNNNNNAYGFGRRGRGSIAGSSVSSSSGAGDGGSVVGGLQHPHHHHPHFQQQQQHHHHQLASNGGGATDPFLSGLGVPSVGSSSFDDVATAETTDADLQAWAVAQQQQQHGLLMDDSTPWATTPTGHWTDARDLATAATQHHHQQHQQQPQWDSVSPSHCWAGGEDSGNNENENHINNNNNGVNTSNAGVVESTTLWSSPPPHEQQQQQQQHPQVPDHHDTWAAWQAIEEAAGGSGQQPWDEEEGPTAAATHNDDDTAAADLGGDSLLGGGGTGLTPRRINRKRSRVDYDDDDGNNNNGSGGSEGGDDGAASSPDGGMRYPASSIRRRKLTHGGGSGSRGVPTAVMGDEYHL
ncbi:hypothetical protein SLS62_008699 [Diatrype stigma]|uniref:TEA domain-containing protein n=1 Tax=Diatrype stigma TaxID=117547 RepID=A0AAN9UI67_9PEZI